MVPGHRGEMGGLPSRHRVGAPRWQRDFSIPAPPSGTSGSPLWSGHTFLVVFVCRAFKPPSSPGREGDA